MLDLATHVAIPHTGLSRGPGEARRPAPQPSLVASVMSLRPLPTATVEGGCEGKLCPELNSPPRGGLIKPHEIQGETFFLSFSSSSLPFFSFFFFRVSFS